MFVLTWFFCNILWLLIHSHTDLLLHFQEYSPLQYLCEPAKYLKARYIALELQKTQHTYIAERAVK